MGNMGNGTLRGSLVGGLIGSALAAVPVMLYGETSAGYLQNAGAAFAPYLSLLQSSLRGTGSGGIAHLGGHLDLASLTAALNGLMREAIHGSAHVLGAGGTLMMGVNGAKSIGRFLGR